MTPEQIAALAAAAAKVDSGRRLALTNLATAAEKLSASLPGDLGVGVGRLKDEINTVLAGMKPLDMVAGAMELNSAIRWFEHSAAEMQELYSRSVARMNETCAKFTGFKPIAELNSMVEAELNSRSQANQIFTKEQLDQATALARKEGEAAAEARLTRNSARVAQAEKLSLGSPAPELLSLEDADFAARVTAAAAQRAKLGTEFGLTDVELNSDTFRPLAWLGEAEFNARVELLRSYAKRGPAAPGGKPAEPLLGGGTVPAEGKPVAKLIL
jgi:hypothetical protein